MKKLLKKGLFAFDGLRVVDIRAIEGLSDAELSQLEACGWVGTDESVASEANERSEDAPDFEFASELGKDDLDSYASGFGVKLDKRKSVEKMFADFKAAF